MDDYFLHLPKLKNGIPKFLVQIYIDFSLKKPAKGEIQFQEDKAKPLLWKEGQESVKQFCKSHGWTYVCIDNNTMNEFVQTHYPEFWDTFWELPYSIERVDILKYLWLHRYGGIYMDMDFIVSKEFSSYVEDLTAPLMVLSSSNMENVITNSFIVCLPKLQLFYNLSETALIEKVPIWAISTHLQVMLCSGPLAFTTFIQKANIPYVILPHDLFFPNNPIMDDKTEKEYKDYIEKLNQSKKSFLIPIKGGTWNSLDTNILNTFNKYRILVVVISSFLFVVQVFKSFNFSTKDSILGLVGILAFLCVVAYLSKT